MSWRTQGLYVHRGRKPHALIGLPLIGRHTQYVGQTNSRYWRDRQHLYGDQMRGKSGSCWTDLDTRIYPLPCLFPKWKFAREIQEKLWILLLLPVYNVEWNKANPRRIKRTKAQAQRWSREANSVKNYARVAVRLMINLLVLGVIIWVAVSQAT